MAEAVALIQAKIHADHTAIFRFIRRGHIAIRSLRRRGKCRRNGNQSLAQCGYDAILVGQAFVTADDPVAALRAFTSSGVG